MLFKRPLFSTSLFIGLLILNSGCNHNRYGICNKPNEIRRYVESGGDPNRYEHLVIYGNWNSINHALPLLACAVGNEDLNLVQLLVSKGANVNASDVTGAKPLNYATRTTRIGGFFPSDLVPDPDRSYEIVKFLIDKGADVNSKADKGTPLYGAVSYEIAELLISRGADVNARISSGETPLHLFSKRGYDLAISPQIKLSIAQLLLKNGADVNVKDSQGSTPLLGVQTEELAKLLIAYGADVNVQNNHKRTSLHEAALHCHAGPELIRVLLEAKAEVNTKDAEGKIPLHDAIRPDCVESVAVLVDAGSDVNLQDNIGISPLIQANKSYQSALSSQYGTYKNEILDYQEMIRIMEAAKNRRSL